ncbi:MAG: holo-ACP synthase [Gemmatimonadetes bacterium]|nr:holo-ACP synthase [Gemmatimonadota bacterium]
MEIRRLRGALARRGERFLARIFTPEEIEDATRGSDFAASIAARFAAKEAAYKALRTWLGRPVPLRSIVISAGRGQAPRVALAGPLGIAAGEVTWWCSLTHTAEYACAVVVLEAAAPSRPASTPADAGPVRSLAAQRRGG